jgi:2-haloacid dehalogenase
MLSRRREFLQGAGGLAAAVGLGIGPFSSTARGDTQPRPGGEVVPVGAVAFDAFTLLDFRVLPSTAERLFPGQGARFEELWRTRLFDYGWLRVIGGQYRDFETVSADAFAFAAATLKLSPPGAVRREYLDTLVQLPTWPEALPVLTRLREAGLKLAFLSNFTPGMLGAIARRTGLDRVMDAPLSTDAVRSYKPDPRAYQLAVDGFRLPRERIAFVAHGGWDAAGAGWFGFPTCWINRTGVPRDELGVTPLATLSSLSTLPDVLGGGGGPHAGSR